MEKKRIWSIRHSLTFNNIPELFLIHLGFQSIKNMNNLPVKGVISDMRSLTKITTNNSLHYKRHIGLHIGLYFQVHEEETPRNSNKLRTKGNCCMSTSGNMQGGLKFMSLRSMRNVTRRYWNMIPMPDTFIDRFHLLVKYQPELLIFNDSKVRLI